jgi:hypothetical protein
VRHFFIFGLANDFVQVEADGQLVGGEQVEPHFSRLGELQHVIRISKEAGNEINLLVKILSLAVLVSGAKVIVLGPLSLLEDLLRVGSGFQFFDFKLRVHAELEVEVSLLVRLVRRCDDGVLVGLFDFAS